MKVAQKIVIQNEIGRILALRRSAIDSNRPLTWDLPGGGIEESEELLQSLKREIIEEIGDEIKVTEIVIHHAVAGYNDKKEYVVVIGYCGKTENPVIKLSHEHNEFKWLTKEEFLQLESSDKIKSFLENLKD